MGIKLQRRELLKMAGGAALAVPMLELTHARRAKAGGSGIPKRYVFMYGGLSTGLGVGDQITPSVVGPGYDLPRALASLGTGALPYTSDYSGYGVAGDVSVVSGLTVPWGAAGETPPPGGRSPGFHYNTMGPQVSGVRGDLEPGGTVAPRGETSDQIVARHIADESHRHLVYRVQAARYIGSNNTGSSSGRISWRDDDGDLVAVEPNASPRLAHESLFSTFVAPDDTDALAALRRRRASLDLVRSRSSALLTKLGTSDRQRMERHLEELEALENRVDAITDLSAACVPPPDPGQDPPIGGPAVDPAEGPLEFGETDGYSDEDARADVLFDLVHMAFACDSARVAAVRLTNDQCFMNIFPAIGVRSDVHRLSHRGQGDAEFNEHADGVGWHVRHFARLIAKLRDTQEYDGSSMLDHTAVVLLFEGGHGFDPQSGSEASSHSTQNMVALVGGRAGGLQMGQHIAGAGAHPASVVLTAMQAVGANVDALGEVDQVIPGLRA